MWSSCKEAAEHNLLSEVRRDIPKFDTSAKLEQLMTKLLKQNSNRGTRSELWATSIRHFGNFARHYPALQPYGKLLAASTRVCRP